jgi:hypothetical protein
MDDLITTRKITSIEEVYEDGILTRQRKHSQVGKEPNFVKLYLKDLTHLRDLPGWVSGILYELLKKMDYNNEIILNSTVKNRIAKELGVVSKTIDNALGKFVQKQILLRQDKGIYLANPYLFGKGLWEDIEEIRMKVTYRPNTEPNIETEVIDRTESTELSFMTSAG